MPEKSATTLRCDSCGAGLSAHSPTCQHCGQVSVILVKGVRFGELLKMFVEAEQIEDVRSLSSEILKEHPQNALAWAAKGLVSVIKNDKSFDSSGLSGCVKCFEFSDKIAAEDGIGSDLKHRAVDVIALALNSYMKKFERQVTSQVSVQIAQLSIAAGSQRSSDDFDMIHRCALAIRSLDPSSFAAMQKPLYGLDDLGEAKLGYVFEDAEYQEERGKHRRTKRGEPKRNKPDKPPGNSKNAVLLGWGVTLTLLVDVWLSHNNQQGLAIAVALALLVAIVLVWVKEKAR